ncbi:MAG: alpha-L-fucosidase, partial [Ruthenibacterium sp.]
MEKTKYFANWESLNAHPIPQWYDECKLGIFIHWGPYSVPAYANPSYQLGEIPIERDWYINNPYAEWYQNSVNVGEGPTYEHHIKTYGKDFPYENFADLWKAEHWNPEEWVQLFEKAGAKYVVLVTKHHDGFCLFPSKYSDFNSTLRGPMRNITGELCDAVNKSTMKMGLYYSGYLN